MGDVNFTSDGQMRLTPSGNQCTTATPREQTSERLGGWTRAPTLALFQPLRRSTSICSRCPCLPRLVLALPTSAIVSSVLNSPPKKLPPPVLPPPRKLPSLRPCRDPVRLWDPWEELRFISASWTSFAAVFVVVVFFPKQNNTKSSFLRLTKTGRCYRLARTERTRKGGGEGRRGGGGFAELAGGETKSPVEKKKHTHTYPHTHGSRYKQPGR